MPETTRITLAVFVIAAALFDVWRRRIPNWLVLVGLGCAFFLAAASRDWRIVGECLVGMVVALVVYVGLYALRAVAAGDAKLMSVVGAFVGVRDWLMVFVLTALAGGAVALIVVLVRGRLVQTVRNVGVILSELAHGRLPHARNPELDVRSHRALRLPHGFSIALGTLLYLSIQGFRAFSA